MAAPAFKDDLPNRESGDVAQYRSLSALAICSLLLGIVSVASLAHPAAWILPLLAASCGFIALARIARQPDVITGRGVALIGVSLGLFFGVWATSRYATERWIVSRQAREFSEQWLNAVADENLEAAHQASLDFYLREPDGTQLKEYYQKDPEQLKAMQDFFSQGMAKQLVDIGKNSTRRAGRTLLTSTDPTSQFIAQRYFIQPDDPAAPELHIQLEMLMELRDDGVYWTMLNVEDAEVLDRPRRY